MAKLWPQVFFAGIKNGQPQMAWGYLLRHPDGSWWCFQDERSAAGDPFEAGMFQLDPSLLKERTEPSGERQVFLYQKVVGDQLATN